MASRTVGKTARHRDGEWRWLLSALVGVAGIVTIYTRVLHVTNPTIAALSFLLIVFGVAAGATLRAAILTSLVATACFHYFFLPQTGPGRSLTPKIGLRCSPCWPPVCWSADYRHTRAFANWKRSKCA